MSIAIPCAPHELISTMSAYLLGGQIYAKACISYGKLMIFKNVPYLLGGSHVACRYLYHAHLMGMLVYVARRLD